MKLCFFGGTFDPPHRGHLTIARAAADRFALDRVLLVPANVPPHKRATPVTDYEHRLAMVKAAVAPQHHSRLVASDIESPAHTAGAPNYSVETLRQLRATLSPGDELYLLLGADAFQSFAKWHQPEEIARLAQFIVCNRPGYNIDAASAALPPALRAAIQMNRVDDVLEDVSATEIRAAVAAGRPLEDLVPPAVAQYIREHRLYS